MERLNLTTRLQFTCALKAPLMQKLEKWTQKSQLPRLSPAIPDHSTPHTCWLLYVQWVQLGRAIKSNCPVAKWPCHSLLTNRQLFPLFFASKNGAAFWSQCRFSANGSTRQLTVICFIFLTGIAGSIWPAYHVLPRVTKPHVMAKFPLFLQRWKFRDLSPRAQICQARPALLTMWQTSIAPQNGCQRVPCGGRCYQLNCNWWCS